MKVEHSTPDTRRARAKRVIAKLPPELRGKRFELVDFREPSAKALEAAKGLQGRAQRAIGRQRAA